MEADPAISFPFNYSVFYQFANEIKKAVNEYYGISEYVIPRQTAGITELRDSETFTSWDDRYLSYNCYAYAIGHYDDRIDPGDLAERYFSVNMDVDEMAQNVKEDLLELGYTVLSVSDIMPTVPVSAHTHLICIRKDLDGYLLEGTGASSRIIDYHFMRLDPDGYWYHKPGGTEPLRYLYLPTNDRPWINEGRGASGELFQYLQWTYDSEIYYILYHSHAYAYEMCGDEQHILVCTICGQTSGTASDCVYVNDYCTSCGRHDHNLGLADRTGNHYHEGLLHYFEYSRVCQDCGAYVYYWESELCSGPPCMVPGLSLQPEEFIS